jgi:PAS domain S-box-containing protein
MADDTKALRDRIDELTRQLEESQQALEAIRRGEVESLVVEGPTGPRIYSLEWSIYSFRVLVEAISVVLYCNSRFAKMLLAPLEHVMGNPLRRWVSENSLPALEELMRQAITGEARAEIRMLNSGGREIPTCLSASTIRDNGELVFCLVATDLTDLRPVVSEKRS